MFQPNIIIVSELPDDGIVLPKHVEAIVKK
jgi:hypothetical protein